MKAPLILKVQEYCRDLLNKSRCKSLQFHNYQHTLNVVNNAALIAEKAKVSDDDIELLIISAYFHDVGNMESNELHETLSCSMARRFLENEKFPEEKILKIENMILATEIQREPTNLLEEIICDADLGHLGKKSFLNENLHLRQEWATFLGKIFTDEEWITLTIKFLENHHFYTEVAHNIFDKQKAKNILSLKNKIS